MKSIFKKYWWLIFLVLIILVLFLFSNFDNNQTLFWIYRRQYLPAWLEAMATLFAAVFAFVGLIIAWKSLNKDLKEQQDQIKAIIKLSENISKQVDTLNQSMAIDSKILTELTKNFQFSNEIQRLQQEKEKINVRPEIIIILTNTTNVSFSEGMVRQHNFHIKNIGLREAKNVRVVPTCTPSENLELIMHIFEQETLSVESGTRNWGIGFAFYHKKFEQVPLPELICKFEIYFEDVYSNKYKVQYKIVQINYHYMKVQKISFEEIK